MLIIHYVLPTLGMLVLLVAMAAPFVHPDPLPAVLFLGGGAALALSAPLWGPPAERGPVGLAARTGWSPLEIGVPPLILFALLLGMWSSRSRAKAGSR
jgi:hypothetical protein